MNKTQLKNFAIQSRRQLIDQVKIKTLMYGIDENNDLEIQEQFGQLMINNKPYPLYMKSAFNSLKNQLEQKGYKQLVEEIAYTWFNRIIAIRYMEVHDYLPEKTNVLSSNLRGVDPDILYEYEAMDLPIKKEEIRELLDLGDTEGAYRKLFIAQCNKLNRILPFLFEKIQDYTELLLPDFLLDTESVIKKLVKNDELTSSFNEIEVIGWLYQYYIAEEKDRVFSQKTKYKREEIPFATQLFTPKWIVQYMVQNSLGRYWTESHREDEDLISNWEYFIKHEEEDFHNKINAYTNKELRIEDIKILDPAMGSGHILVYAFEVLHQIYEKRGYPQHDIPRLILENNLYGLDIDDRAYQLAAFAIVMKASSYSRRFLRSIERKGIQLNLASIQESNYLTNDFITYVAQENEGERYNQIKSFVNQYYNGKTYGSLIKISETNLTFIEERLEYIQNHPVEDLFYGEQHNIALKILPALVHQTKIMKKKYDVLVMNPPYMGSGNMNKDLLDLMKNSYPDSKSDLFSAFMEVNQYLKQNGFYSAINQHSWMFLSSLEKLRHKVISNEFIDTMLHLGPRAFEEISGEVVQSTVFVKRNYNCNSLKGIYFRLIDFNTPEKKKSSLIEAIKYKDSPIRFEFYQKDFEKIPGNPIIYWISKNIVKIFSDYSDFGEKVEGKVGLQTGNNDLFLKYWFEISYKDIAFNCKNSIEFENSGFKWIPYNKGGGYRKWYGNREFVINWENDGSAIKNYYDSKGSLKSVVRNPTYYFKPSISWSDITTANNSFRIYEEGFIFDTTGHSAFPNTEINQYNLLAVLNNNFFNYIIKMLNPTLHFSVGYFNKLPATFLKNAKSEELVKLNIELSKKDWDFYETSWDFSSHPLVNAGLSLESVYKDWENELITNFELIKNSEIELNAMFNSEFNLSDEISSDVNEKTISLSRPNKKFDTSTLLSYFIGCLMGRFNLNEDGIIYAGGEWDDSKYTSFKPISNGVIYLTESPYFENDIIAHLREFLSASFSPDKIDENMQWLAEALEMKKGEDAEARLRRYFLDEFYLDHCKMYRKRPIYWLVDSGNKKGLRALIYMHRYKPDTMATIRFEHLQEIQAKYQNEINDLENKLINPNLSASEKKKLIIKKKTFENKIDELQKFDKQLAKVATDNIEIELDDGVKVNYEKFYQDGKGVLAKIK